MIFAKAKTRHVCMMQTARAGQGSPGSLAFWLVPEQKSHDESSDWPTGQTDGQAARGCRDLYSRQSANGFPWLEAM